MAAGMISLPVALALLRVFSMNPLLTGLELDALVPSDPSFP